jgi:hypothetical protein
MEDSHVPTLQVAISTIYRRNRQKEPETNRSAAVDAIFRRRLCALLTVQAGDSEPGGCPNRVADGAR